MKPSLTPLDREWLRLLDRQAARVDACLPALVVLVAIVRAAKTHLRRPEQDPARKAAVMALERLGWTSFQRDGITLRYVPAQLVMGGDEAVVVRAAHVKASFDRRAADKASPGANVVDLTARLRAPLAKTKLRGEGPAKRCRECLNFERERVGRSRGATA